MSERDNSARAIITNLMMTAGAYVLLGSWLNGIVFGLLVRSVVFGAAFAVVCAVVGIVLFWLGAICREKDLETPSD